MDKGPRVLLILKPSPAREALAKSLSESGWVVDATASTFRGVSGLAREPRQAVVFGLDDVMDEELEAVQVIRTDCPTCFILVTFSHTNRRKAQRAIELGANAYVLEPLNVQEVVATLRSLAGNQSMTEPLPAAPAPEPVEEPQTPMIPQAMPAPKMEKAPSPERSGLKPQEIAERFPNVPRKESPATPAPRQTPDASQANLVSMQKLGASIAHEINNPLTTLSGWIQLLLRKTNGNQDMRRTLVSMKEEADRISDVVRELTAMTEPGSPASESSGSDNGRQDFNTLVSKVIDDFLATNGNASIQVKTVFTDDPLHVNMDGELVARAISDFLNSRYLSIGSSGSLVFRTMRTGPFAELHVYEPGSQVDLTPLHKALQTLDLNEGETIGQDLSLARAKQIIDSYKGSFRADCQMREGLSFVVKFPVVD